MAVSVASCLIYVSGTAFATVLTIDDSLEMFVKAFPMQPVHLTNKHKPPLDDSLPRQCLGPKKTYTGFFTYTSSTCGAENWIHTFLLTH